MIPDEAVEAAAKALYKGQPIYDEEACVITGHKLWEWMEPAYQEAMLTEARTALEAAAPHMPRTITTAEELDALPKDSVVLSGGAVPRIKASGNRWLGEVIDVDSEHIIRWTNYATVLHEPEAAS